ncbi:MAG: hypothetical protein ABIR63_07725 [Sphingomicrobium sp.]
MAKLRERFEKQWPLIGKHLFEIVIIFIGVTAAFALEGARQDREEQRYRATMIAAMIPLFDDFTRHNRDLYAMEPKLAAFERAVAAGETPMIPVFRERGSERAPVRSWDGIVSTGISRALPPKLYMDLSLFFTRQESLSERYVRYISFAEAEIEPLRSDPRHFYEAGTRRLKPAYAASIDQLRGIIAGTRLTEQQARELKPQLGALN